MQHKKHTSIHCLQLILFLAYAHLNSTNLTVVNPNKKFDWLCENWDDADVTKAQNVSLMW
jgi:hypothetical protein